MLLICLVPVRYRIKARVAEGFKAKGGVSWLLRLIHVTFAAINAQILCRVRLLGFCLKKLHLGKWGEEEPEKTGDASETSEETDKETESKEKKQNRKSEAKTSGPDKDDADEEGKKDPEEEKKPNKKPDKYEAMFKALEEREKKKEAEKTKAAAGETADEASSDDPSAGTAEKIQAFIDKVTDFWDDDKNRDAVALIERQLLRLGRHLLPTHFLLEGRIGLKDPGSTGQLIGKIYRFYPLYGEHIRVDGVFDRKTVDLYTELKGRLRLGVLVEIVIRLLLNKRCRTWVKQLMKKDKTEKKNKQPEDAQRGRAETDENANG